MWCRTFRLLDDEDPEDVEWEMDADSEAKMSMNSKQQNDQDQDEKSTSTGAIKRSRTRRNSCAYYGTNHAKNGVNDHMEVYRMQNQFQRWELQPIRKLQKQSKRRKAQVSELTAKFFTLVSTSQTIIEGLRYEFCCHSRNYDWR